MSLAAAFRAPPLSPRARQIFWAMLVIAAVGRVIVAFSTRGVGFDIAAYNMVLDALRDQPLSSTRW